MTIVMKGLAMAFGLGVSLLIARVLGPEARGVYALLMTIIVIAVGFGVLGWTASNTFLVARNPKRQKAIGFYSLIVGAAGAILSAAAVIALKSSYPQTLQGLDGTLFWLTLGLIPLFLWGNLFSFAWLGRGNILAFNLFETGQRFIFALLAVVMFLFLFSDMTNYMIWVVSGVGLLVAAYVFWYFKTSAEGPLNDLSLVKPAFIFGSKSFIGTLFAVAVMRSAVLFVNHFHGNYDAGLYAVAQQISELLVIVPSVVGTILFGRVAAGERHGLTPKVVRIMALLFLPVTLLMVLFSDFLVGLFGSEFLAASLPLCIMLPGCFLLGLQVILVNDIAGRGYPWPAALVWIPILAFNLTSFTWLVPEMGINGAALTISLSFAAVFIYMSIYYCRLTKISARECFIAKWSDLAELNSFVRNSLASGTKRQQPQDMVNEPVHH